MNKISPRARIGSNVKIGDFTVINDDVEIADNVEIGNCVLIDNGARISQGVKIHHGAVISSIPQDLKFKGEYSLLEIGENTVVREFATLNRGTAASGRTVIGKNVLLMAYSHTAHDCVIGNNVILANSVNLGGHVIIDDWAIIGGLTGVHQFCRIGAHSFVEAGRKVGKDIPPFVMAARDPLAYAGINSVGLRRRNFSSERINKIKSAYEIIYGPVYNTTEALLKIKSEFELNDDLKIIVDFIEKRSRGII